MKQFLEKVRTAQRQSFQKQIIATTGVILLSVALGVLQKCESCGIKSAKSAE